MSLRWPLLCAVILCAGMFPAWGKEPVKTISYPAPSAEETRIRDALSHKTEVRFSETPLREAVKFLQDLHQINIILDATSLQDDGIDPESPLSLEVSGITLRGTLRLLLQPYGLTYVVEQEILKITTQAKADELMVTRVYPVSDLASNEAEMESIVQAIRAGCLPQKWDEAYGSTITPVLKIHALVIRQNDAVHEEIGQLLQSLRMVESVPKAVGTTTDVPAFKGR